MTEKQELPGFVTGWMITDLVFSGIRIVIILIGIVGVRSIPVDSPEYQQILTQITTNGLLAFTSIAAALLILFHHKIGIYLGYLALFFVGVSICSGIWGSFENRTPENDAYFSGMIVGMILTLIVRLTLAGFYFKALQKANKFFSESERGTV